jgi:hypothetical protein
MSHALPDTENLIRIEPMNRNRLTLAAMIALILLALNCWAGALQVQEPV